MDNNKNNNNNEEVNKNETEGSDESEFSELNNEDLKSKNGEIKRGESSDKDTNNRKSFFYGVLAIVVIIILSGTGYVYYAVNNLSENPTVVKAAEILKIPAAKVNGDKVLYSDYVNQKQTLNKFYNSQPKNLKTNFSDEQVSKQVMSRLIANKILFQVADNRGVEVTQEDIDSMKDRIKKRAPKDKNIEQMIQNRYGWTMDKYVENVIKPTVLRQKVEQDYLSETGMDTSTKKKAEEVLKKAKDGEDFEQLAENYGSQTTRKRKGDLGWFGKGVMVPKFEEVAFSLETGQISQDLIKTKFGYHIIKVEDKRTTTTEKGEEKEQIKARHILFQNKNSGKFRQFMNNKLKQADIEMMIPIKNPFKQRLNQQGQAANRQRQGVSQQGQGTKQMNKKEIKKKIQKKIQQQQQNAGNSTGQNTNQ